MSFLNNFFAKKVFGVSSWLGKKVGVKPSFIRLIFIYASFINLITILVYLIMVFLLLKIIKFHILSLIKLTSIQKSFLILIYQLRMHIHSEKMQVLEVIHHLVKRQLLVKLCLILKSFGIMVRSLTILMTIEY